MGGPHEADHDTLIVRENMDPGSEAGDPVVIIELLNRVPGLDPGSSFFFWTPTFVGETQRWRGLPTTAKPDEPTLR